jgi:hypothetical protein
LFWVVINIDLECGVSEEGQRRTYKWFEKDTLWLSLTHTNSCSLSKLLFFSFRESHAKDIMLHNQNFWLRLKKLVVDFGV